MMLLITAKKCVCIGRYRHQSFILHYISTGTGKKTKGGLALDQIRPGLAS